MVDLRVSRFPTGGQGERSSGNEIAAGVKSGEERQDDLCICFISASPEGSEVSLDYNRERGANCHCLIIVSYDLIKRNYIRSPWSR